MKACVTIMLKAGVRDPQGRAVAAALARLGYDSVKDARQGKHIEIILHDDGADEAQLRQKLEAMCHEFLVNPVIEEYSLSIEETP